MGRNVKIMSGSGATLEMWKERAGNMGVKLDDKVDVAVGSFVEADMLQIRDHLNKAYPVPNEAMSRVEAERDGWKEQRDILADYCRRADERARAAQAKLAEAVGLVRQMPASAERNAFLARAALAAQAEQQGAK